MKPIAEIKQKIESLLRNHNEEYIEIHGRENLLAEGYCRIIDYGESKITFASETKTICIKGEKYFSNCDVGEGYTAMSFVNDAGFTAVQSISTATLRQ